jgi:hypothetical protein
MLQAMRMLALLVLASCGHASPIHWARLPAGTTENLISVACTEAGDAYAIDDKGQAHDLRGHASPLVADADKTSAAHFKLPGAAPYGRYQIEATARDRAHVFALGRFMAISNSLENDFAYLLRSDDAGATWAAVWTGPDRGPMGMGDRKAPDVGAALAVLPSGVALAASDGAVLISSDGGKTFIRHATSVAEPLAALWASATGVLYGVGHRGEIVISTDKGNTFAATREGDADLAAITGCGDEIWIVGARGTVLSRRSR